MNDKTDRTNNEMKKRAKSTDYCDRGSALQLAFAPHQHLASD